MPRALTMAEVESIKAMGGTARSASRSMHNGRSVDILNAEPADLHYTRGIGTNVIHQRVYWDLTREQANHVAKLTGTRLVFDATTDAEQAQLDATRERQTAEHLASIEATGATCKCALHR